MRKKATRKTPRKPARPVRARKAPARSARVVAVPRPIKSRGVLIAIIALSGAAVLLSMGRARIPETPADVHLDGAAPVEESVSAPPPEVAEPVTAKAPAPMPGTIAETKPPTPPVVDTPAPIHAVAAPPAGVISTLDRPTAETNPAVDTTTTAVVSGCLTLDDGAYRLKDASGTDAPKSRSWKSGFIRKRSATIDVVDAGALGLSNYVGQRVEVTGTLREREMQPRSLQRLAESCKR